MPFSSSKQRRYMHAKHPEVAQRYEREAKASGKPPVQRPARSPKRPK